MKDFTVNGEVLHFPDTMSDDEIKGVLRQKFPPKGKPDSMGTQIGRGVSRGVEEMGRNFRNLGVGPALESASSAMGMPLPAIPTQGADWSPPGPESPQSAGAWQGYSAAYPAAEWARLGTRMMPALAGAAAPGGLPGQVLAGIASSAFDENPLSSSAWNTAGTTILGNAGRVGGKLANAFKSKFANVPVGDVKNRSLLEKAQKEGLPLNVLDATGKNEFSMLSGEAHPRTRDVFRAFRDTQQDFLQQRLAKSMGTKMVDFSDDGLRAIKDELSNKYKLIATEVSKQNGGAGVALDKGFSDSIEKLLDDRTFAGFKDELASGTISGPRFLKLRSEISSLTNHATKDTDAIKLIRDLDEEFGKQVPTQLKKTYDMTREQFRNLFDVESLRSQAARSSAGEVSAKALQSKLRADYGLNAPRNQATKKLLDATGAMAGIRAGGAEARSGLAPIDSASRYVLGLLPALKGTYHMGADAPLAAYLSGNIGRMLAGEPLRKKTPYYLSPTDEQQ